MLSIDEINSLHKDRENLKSEIVLINKQYNSLLNRYNEALLTHKNLCEKILKVCNNNGTLKEIKEIIEKG